MKPVEFRVAMEPFTSPHSCSVSVATVGLGQSLVLEDSKFHPLKLSITTEILGGTAL